MNYKKLIDCFFLRNTAVETVEQKLLFVGTENGKLVAMRDIIKKVRTLQSRLFDSFLKLEIIIILKLTEVTVIQSFSAKLSQFKS